MYKDKKILAFITARGGSKTLRLKNIKTFCNRPLLYWVVRAAKKSRYIDSIVVSTDNTRIADIAKRYGAEAPFLRPKNLAGDRTSSIDVAIHFLKYLRRKKEEVPDIFLLLQPTSPLLLAKDIDKACEKLISAKRADALVSITEVSETPYKMKRIDKGGFLKDFIEQREKTYIRQDLPSIYRPNGAIHMCKTDVLMKKKDFFPKRTIYYLIPKERSVDIDDIIDFKLAEMLLKNYLKSHRGPR